MNGRERCEGQVVPCGSIRDLMLVVAGGSRLEILEKLLDASRDVSTLADVLELEQSRVSCNLRLLRENGLVGVTPFRKNRFYHLTEHVCGSIRDPFLNLTITTVREESLSLRMRYPTAGATRDSSAM